MAESWTLTNEDCVRLVVLREILDGLGPDAPRVQVDLVAARDLAGAREQFELLRPAPNVERLSDAVNPLIIDDAGRCLPFAYGVDPRFELSRLPVSDQGAFRPRAEQMERLTVLLRLAFLEAELPDAAYLDWFAHLARLSRRLAGVDLPAFANASD
jgi:hypothetical protein